MYVGSALATTAIGTLLPILTDTGEMQTRFGTYLLAAGAVGEFGPILLLTLVLSTQSALHNAVILIAFVALAVAVAVLAVRSSHRTIPVFARTIEKSSQLAVRWIVVLVFALTLLASDLGLDLLLGGFAAGLITRQVLQKQEVPSFDSKLTAVAFGVFIPFFFVMSGMRLDVDALFASVSGVLKLALFFVLFLVVRGTPALLLYRGVLPLREDRMALALFTATQLPLVVAITTVAVDAGKMRSSTAAALVGAGALSTLAGPLHGLRMRRIAALKRAEEPGDEGAPARGGAGHAMSPAGADHAHHAHHHLEATSRLFRLRIRLSSAMWLPVLAANVVAVALAIGLPVLDEHIGDQQALPITTSAAQTIFGALAGGMITFTGIVFSAVFVAAQIQTSSYSPRLAARIRRDPVVIAGLAFPTASASYALVALAAIGRQTNASGDFVPAVTVLFGLVLAGVTLGAFVALVQRAFESTQIGGILRTLMRRAYAVIDDVHPRDAPAEDARGAAGRRPAARDHAHGLTGRHRRDRPRGAPARRRADRRLRGRRPGRGRVPRLGPGRPAHQRRP